MGYIQKSRHIEGRKKTEDKNILKSPEAHERKEMGYTVAPSHVIKAVELGPRYAAALIRECLRFCESTLISAPTTPNRWAHLNDCFVVLFAAWTVCVYACVKVMHI